MVTIQVYQRYEADEPAQSLGWYKFEIVPRIGEIVRGCGSSADIPGDTLRIIEIVHNAVPEKSQFADKDLAELFGSPEVAIIGEAIFR